MKNSNINTTKNVSIKNKRKVKTYIKYQTENLFLVCMLLQLFNGFQSYNRMFYLIKAVGLY